MLASTLFDPGTLNTCCILMKTFPAKSASLEKQPSPHGFPFDTMSEGTIGYLTQHFLPSSAGTWLSVSALFSACWKSNIIFPTSFAPLSRPFMKSTSLKLLLINPGHSSSSTSLFPPSKFSPPLSENIICLGTGFLLAILGNGGTNEPSTSFFVMSVVVASVIPRFCGVLSSGESYIEMAQSRRSFIKHSTCAMINLQKLYTEG